MKLELEKSEKGNYLQLRNCRKLGRLEEQPFLTLLFPKDKVCMVMLHSLLLSQNCILWELNPCTEALRHPFHFQRLRLGTKFSPWPSHNCSPVRLSATTALRVFWQVFMPASTSQVFSCALTHWYPPHPDLKDCATRSDTPRSVISLLSSGLIAQSYPKISPQQHLH